MGVIGQSALAAPPCDKAAPETVNQFLEGLTNGSIQLADRIDLPFNTGYFYCPTGGKPGNTCFPTEYAAYVDLPSLKTTSADSKAEPDRPTKSQPAPGINSQVSYVGTLSKEAVAEKIAALEQSGLRHASLGHAKVRTAALNRGGIQIRLYTPADEW
ncbi:MAG: hypothetical protein JF626_12660, partial [Polaromonas sp.]|nr:hypothetical protein [Polaromonas sp.]